MIQYSDNPFVEAIPPMLSYMDMMRKIESIRLCWQMCRYGL